MATQISGNNPVKFKNDVSIEGNLQVNGNIINADGKDMIPHLYLLSFYFSDTTYTTLVNDIGTFKLDTEYDLVDNSGNVLITQEQATELTHIFEKISQGNYNAIPFNLTSDIEYGLNNHSNEDYIRFDDANGVSLIELDLSSLRLYESNQEDWYYKFIKLI